MTLTSDPPFSHLGRRPGKSMAEQMMQKGYFNFCPSETWTPSVNVYETPGAFVVCVDLAGVEKEKIDLELVENRLRLRGHRHAPTYDFEDETGGIAGPGAGGGGSAAGGAADHAPGQSVQSATRRVRVHLMEIDHGGFSREVELPPEGVNRDKIRAQYRNGMLWIEIPKD